jgi:hypothetical protein
LWIVEIIFEPVVRTDRVCDAVAIQIDKPYILAFEIETRGNAVSLERTLVPITPET